LEFGVEFFATDLWIIKILVASLSGLLSFGKVLNQECKKLLWKLNFKVCMRIFVIS